MSKGGGGSTNTVQKADPWAGQQPYLTDVYSQAQQLYGMGGPQVYQGRTYADPTEKTALAEALQVGTALGPQAQLASDLAGAQQFALGGPMNLASNPYLAGATEAALRPVYSQAQGLLQQARRGATQAGQLGGTRQAILEQGVIGDYMTKAGDISSKMYNQAYRDSLTQQARALYSTPQTLAAMSVPAQTLGQVGMAEQAREQLAIDEARARFEAEQQRPYQALQDYSGLVQANILPGTRTTSMNAPDPTFGQRALGGAALGLGTQAALTSSSLLGNSALTATAAAPYAIAAGLASAVGLFD